MNDAHSTQHYSYRGSPAMLRSDHRLALLEVDRVVELSLEGLNVTSMLDVGTGTGIFAQAFARRGLRVAGIDSSPEMVALAAQHVPEGEFREAPAEALPFPDGAFDLVFLGHVLHELDSPLPALQEACRVASLRVAVLEWPYRLQPFGPPLQHRLVPQTIENLAASIGCVGVESFRLQHMSYIRLTWGDHHAPVPA